MPTLGEVAQYSHEAWETHLGALRPLWDGKRLPALDQRGIVFGELPRDMAEVLAVALVASSKVTTAFGDYMQGCIPSAYHPQEIAEINETSSFCSGDETRGVIQAALDYLTNQVALILGCPWRVLNVRSWETLKVATGGPAKWHRDGGPAQMLKIMLYPNGGGIEVDVGNDKRQRIIGAGIWALFYNSLLHHAAVAEPGRVATEITIVPSREFDVRVVSCGTNGKYPVRPPL